MTIEKKKSFIVNITFIAIVLALVFLAFRYAFSLLFPFIIGLLCAIILRNPVAWLTEKTKIPRGVWSFIMVFLLLGAILVGIGLIGSLLYEQLVQLIASLTDKFPSLSSTFSFITHWYNGIVSKLPDTFENALHSASQSVTSGVIGYLSDLVTAFAAVAISNLPSILIGTVMSLIACCFITADYNRISNFVLLQFSDKNKELIKKGKSLFVDNILKVLRGYLLIMCITFCEMLIGLSILGVEYSAVLALIIALFDILPILGTGGILIPWGVFSILTGKTLFGIELLILYAVVTVIRSAIEPKIIGNQVGLPTVVTLISMYVGLKLFGILGVWGMPVLIIIIVKLQDAGLIHIWKTSKSVENPTNEPSEPQPEESPHT